MKRPTDDEIKAEIAKIDGDERFHYPPALVEVNAPLALIQVDMQSRANALAWVLGIAPPKAYARARKRPSAPIAHTAKRNQP